MLENLFLFYKLSIGTAEAQLHSDWSMEPGTRVMPGSSTKYDRLQISDFRLQITDFRFQITITITWVDFGF